MNEQNPNGIGNTRRTADIRGNRATFAVDPARLAHGEWCHRREKTIGQGDISASYSAERIGMGQPVRKPFEHQGSPWICVSTERRNGIVTAEAYRLVHPSQFTGEPITYHEKLRDTDAARADPNGFYHAMSVSCAGQTLVLCGPPALFVPGQAEQFELFD